MIAILSDMEAANSRPEDLLEESHAAALVRKQLANKPIIETSGDLEHQLQPSNIRFTVGMTETGESLSVSMLNPDRHHPGLVHATMERLLAEMPEFKDRKPRHHTEDDYVPEEGRMTMHFDVPRGDADKIIHALGTRAEQEGLIPGVAPAAPTAAAQAAVAPAADPALASTLQWSDRAPQPATAAQAADPTFAGRMMSYLGINSERGR